MELFDTVITEEARRRVNECLNSGYVSEGTLVKEFEHAMEEKFGYKYCVAVNSCTSALHLVLYEIGVVEGSEVIIPAQTFIATGMAVLYCGAKVVFADIDIQTGNISVEDVERKINHKTRAVISVAWGGNPPDLPRLHKLCEDKNIYLIQDNAQALGATYYGKPVTEYGDFSCFSFQATKHLTTGDGGLIVPNSQVDQQLLKMLRWFTIDREDELPDESGERQYVAYEVGFKYHMNDYAAALGLGNLHGLGDRIKRRISVAEYYRKSIKLGGHVNKIKGCSYWIHDMLVDEPVNFRRAMKDRGIPVSVIHRGIHRQPVFDWDDELPNQEYWDEHHVALPCHSSLTYEDIGDVVDAINKGW